MMGVSWTMYKSRTNKCILTLFLGNNYGKFEPFYVFSQVNNRIRNIRSCRFYFVLQKFSHVTQIQQYLKGTQMDIVYLRRCLFCLFSLTVLSLSIHGRDHQSSLLFGRLTSKSQRKLILQHFLQKEDKTDKTMDLPVYKIVYKKTYI